jgi:hypothetical protein
LSRLFDATQSHRYIDNLQDIVDNYNSTHHSTLGIAPDEVDEDNEANLKEKLYAPKPQIPFHFAVGDIVRISMAKRTFGKESTVQKWSHELFTVAHVLHTNPPTYKLEDHKKDPILGIFYNQELQEAKKPDTYKVEGILKRRTLKGRKEVLVKWLGYPESEATWEPASQIPGEAP